MNIPATTAITNGPDSHGDFNSIRSSHPFVSENMYSLGSHFQITSTKKKPTHFATHRLQMAKIVMLIYVRILVWYLHLFDLFCLAHGSDCFFLFQFSTRTIRHRINCAFQLHCVRWTWNGEKKMRKLKLKYKFTEATPCPCRSKIIRSLVQIQKRSIFCYFTCNKNANDSDS